MIRKRIPVDALTVLRREIPVDIGPEASQQIDRFRKPLQDKLVNILKTADWDSHPTYASLSQSLATLKELYSDSSWVMKDLVHKELLKTVKTVR